MRADLSLAKLRGQLVIPSQFTSSFLQRLLSKVLSHGNQEKAHSLNVQDQYDEWLYYYGVKEAFEGDAVQQMKISLDTSNPGVALVLRFLMLMLMLMLPSDTTISPVLRITNCKFSGDLDITK